MATHGSLGEFDHRTGDWKSYVERAQQYFAANDVESAGKKRAILLSSVGNKTYRIIKDVLAPDAPAEVTFANIEKMTKHFQPPPSEIVQRFQFHTRVRQPHESVATYIAQLKQIAEHCKFGDTARINEMLRDRLVCGIANEKWQQRLLAEEELTYDQARKQLLSLEAAEKGLRDLAGDKSIHSVQRTSNSARSRQQRRNPSAQQSSQPRDMVCTHCGGPHDPSTCRFKSAECHYCHKRGHLAVICRKKLKKLTSPQTSGGKATHTVEREDTESNPPEEYNDTMFNVRAPNNKPITVELLIQGASVSMEVDTGATLSIMTHQTYGSTWQKDQAPPIMPSTSKLCTYTGEKIEVIGAIDVDVEYKNQKTKLNLLVVKGSGPSLLGRDWLQYIQLDWAQLNKVQTEHASKLEKLLNAHTALFTPGLGKIEGVKAKLYLKKNAKPKFLRARQVPLAI